ncbi:MAG: DUF481 domain-containing protein [bacterium]|nr:MAG: DUF481 domain-containing protein [bacterium]
MKRFLLILISTAITSNAWAQNDSLLFDNNIVIVGEIKNLNRGIITIETEFSDSDFKIEWNKVKEIYGTQEYIITLSDGNRLKGSISTDPSEKSKVIISDAYQTLAVSLNNVVFMKPLEEGFLQKLSASVDLGFNLTKANNLRQLSLRSKVGYLTNRWSTDGFLDITRSDQDSIAATRRTDASVGFNYFLGKRWFAFISSKFLQSDEQKLELRATPLIGIGNYFIQTNSMYWALVGGIARTIEFYTDPTIEDRSSSEANLGTELNLFDMGDLGLVTTLAVYRSLNEGDRIRADFKFDIKYDLPLDFYIRLGYTHNFDNQPVEGASRNDWDLSMTFGWEL